MISLGDKINYGISGGIDFNTPLHYLRISVSGWTFPVAENGKPQGGSVPSIDC